MGKRITLNLTDREAEMLMDLSGRLQKNLSQTLIEALEVRLGITRVMQDEKADVFAKGTDGTKQLIISR